MSDKREQLRDRIEAAEARQKAREIGQRAAGAADRVTTFAREHPLLLIAGGLAVGAALSTLIPRSPQHTTNIVEFYYPEEIALFEREFVEAERAAYMETAHEDDIIAQRMDRGRRILMQRGENDAGPYQSPMEDGMMHFHEYVRARLGPHL